MKKYLPEAINDPDVCALSIATRPDCLPPAVLELLGRLNRIKPVWVELGLQTVNSETARFIRSGYPTGLYLIMRRTGFSMLGITVIVHVILFLPYETKEMMFHTIDHLNKLDIQGIKLQLLHILKGTDLAAVYEKITFSRTRIWKNISNCSGHVSQNCSPDIIVHRLTGDGPKELLIAPLMDKRKTNRLKSVSSIFKATRHLAGKGLSCLKHLHCIN